MTNKETINRNLGLTFDFVKFRKNPRYETFIFVKFTSLKNRNATKNLY